MKQVIQHIIFPDDESLTDCWELFYRGDRGRLTGLDSNGHLCMAKYHYTEFCTYLNGLSWAKWKKYTSATSVTLHLEFVGSAEISLTGYTLLLDKPVRFCFSRHTFSNEERTEVVLTFPENEQTIIGFEISALSDLELFGGYFEAGFPDDSVRNIELALTTTTFRREEYIRNNTRRIAEGLFARYPEISEHICMHIVDNGRTLSEHDIPDDPHFILHPNPNAGGSGGYARGMIECLHQEPAATHALLMDDDIMILPESLYRTYQLLHFLKPEYQDHFIGGAMLSLENKLSQYEDCGHVKDDGFWSPVKPILDHSLLADNLRNEQEYHTKDMYQAWWYCCIPVTVIKKNGLPLPLFIRSDDVEYSLRCHAQIINMNGICLWHMGFGGKYSASMNIYQEFRNLWVIQSTTGVLADRDLTGRFHFKFRECLLTHNYVGAQMALRALDDFMKGPEFFMENNGESIMKELSKKNEKLLPFKEVPLTGVDYMVDPYQDKKREFMETLLYRLTWNGHILWPEKLLKQEPLVVPVELAYLPGKIPMRKTYVAIDSANHKATVREVDKKVFWDLMKSYAQKMLYFRRHEDEIRRAYREKRDYLTSEEFWNKYLGLTANS